MIEVGNEEAMTLDKNKLKELCEKATKGPWRFDDDGLGYEVISKSSGTICQIESADDAEDAAFIAEARTALPALLAELEAAERTIQFQTGVQQGTVASLQAAEERVRELTKEVAESRRCFDAMQSDRDNYSALYESGKSRLSVMETALRNAFVIIEGLNISIEWELAPEIKKAIAESSKEIMKALSDQGGNNGA